MTNLSQKNDIEKMFFTNAPKVETHIVTITPEIAKKLLDKTDSKIQRKINHRHVTSLSEEMKKGDFCLNGDAIRQDINGNIIDGQHRLAACVKSNTSIRTLIVKGLPTENIHTIDIGNKSRSLADVLEINHKKKYKYTNSIAAAVKFIFRFNHNIFGTTGHKGGNQSLSSSEFLEWVALNPNIIDFVEETMRLRANGDKLVTPAMFCGLKWILDRYNKEHSDIFFQQLSDGIGLSKESSIFTLRKKILSTKYSFSGSSKVSLSNKQLIFITIRTWNAFIKEESLTYLKVPSELPKILS